MSKFTPITLTATVSSYAGSLLYGEVDGTGLQSQYRTFDVVLSSLSTQNHSDASTREPLLYNGLDVDAGMFIADDSANTIVKIISISAKSETALTCVVEDVDMVSFRLNSQNTIAQSGNVIIFSLNPEGEPIVVGAPFLAGGMDKLQSRFNLNERDDRVKFVHSSAPSVEEGDVVTVNSSGDLVKYGAAGGSDIKVGTVVEIIRNGKDVFVKPFNDIIRNYKAPESLTGNPGNVYYTDVNNAGEITTATGGKAVYLHLNTASATTQAITSSTLPGGTDVFTINGVTIFDGPNGDSVADSNALSTLINNSSSSTNVSSAITQAPGTVDSESNTLAYAGSWGTHDIFIPLNANGGAPPANFPEISVSDGNNSTNVVFDTADASAIGYDVISPAGIASLIETAVQNAGLDILVETYTSSAHNGDAVRLTTTGSATGITLANVTADPFGGNVVGAGSSTGIGTSATLGAATLTLTRTSGGDILIDGSPNSGGFINQGGVVSSNSGRVPFLLLIESEGGGGGLTEVGVPFKEDFAPSATTADEDTTGITITYTPFNDADIMIRVNGLQTDFGDGAKDEPCYFSADGGSTARAAADVTAGDTLYWMGSVAGYELDNTDEIDLRYEKSSND